MADSTAPMPASHGASNPPLKSTWKVIPVVARRELRKKSGTTPFLIWISFLLSFSISRAYVLLFGGIGRGADSGGTRNINFEIGRNIIIHGYHLHHIAIGFVLLALAGWLALHYRGRLIARSSAIMYGIGLGFVVDEIGFIIGGIRPYRGDVEVFYVAVALGALLFSAVYFPSFWRGVRQDARSIARLVSRIPSLREPGQADRRRVAAEVEAALGPVERYDPDADPARPPPLDVQPAGAATAVPGTGTSAFAAGTGVAVAVEPSSRATPPGAVQVNLDKDALFTRLLGKVIDMMILLIFAGLLLGLAKLVLSLGNVFLGLSVAAMMQPILVGILTLLIGVELFRAMVEYVRSGRIMLPFLVDAGILLGLRELASELYLRTPDPILVAVIGGTLVALGGLRVFLVRTMLPGDHARPKKEANQD